MPFSGFRPSRRSCAPAGSVAPSSTWPPTSPGRSTSAARCSATATFVEAHPIATKRFLRAVLKTADLCTSEPQLVARRLVDAGLTKRYDYALQSLTELPYASWREFDPEDTVRFFALRLHEVGMIKSTPQAIIADGTDWRFLNELKRELKA